MPAAPTLITSVVDGVTTGHVSDHMVIHPVINSIYKASIGTTRTTAFTLTQAMSGESIPVNVSSSIAVTVPVLEQGTSIELIRIGTAGFTLTASGITLLVPTGATATPRVQNSPISLLWLSTTSVLVGGDLT